MFACSSPTSIREVERRDDYAVIADSPLRIATLKVGDMLGRDPHTLLNPGYYKQATIRTDLAAAGFQEVQIERVARPAKAAVGAGRQRWSRSMARFCARRSKRRIPLVSARRLTRLSRLCAPGSAMDRSSGKQGADRHDRKTAVTTTIVAIGRAAKTTQMTR